MKTNIFIPKTIKVGFQNRNDTYTQKLAYVIYIDEKGKVRKESSWQNWRDKSIDPVDYTNEPTSGFVLNKKAGGYSTGWNHRQTYTRVYDPRGFEFEITIPNLLYILENTNSIKGKGLEGDFVYGWDGSDLILVPTESPDYIEISQFNQILHERNYIKSKDLVIGGTYKAKDNAEWIYMGRFDYHTTKWIRPRGDEESRYEDVNKGKHYFFAVWAKDYQGKAYLNLLILKSLGDKFIGSISSDCSEDYANMFDHLERQTQYSPYDKLKDEYVIYELQSFIDAVPDRWYGKTVYLEKHEEGSATVKKASNQDIFKVTVPERVKNYWNSSYSTQEKTIFEGTLEEIFYKFNPMYKNKYLANGKLYQKGE